MNPQRVGRMARSSVSVECLERRQLLAAISGTLWEDLNTSRTRDGNEQGLAGWTVFIDSNRNRALDPGEFSTITDANGNYTFDNIPAGTYYLGAVLQEGYGQTYPSWEGSRTTDFKIDLSYSGTVSSSLRADFDAAARFWESIIVGDQPDVTDFRGTVDDIQLDITIDAVDGRGGVLGFAGPGAFRDKGLAHRGGITFDVADTAPGTDAFRATILHEMGHALGFVQEVWEDLGLLSGILGGYSPNPRFIGAQATAQFNQLLGRNETSVPLEPGTGRDGSSISHWRESILGNELMTPYLNDGPNPLSRLTIGALADMGYEVSYAFAEPYPTVGGSGSAVVPGFEPFLQTVTVEVEDRTGIDFGVRTNERPRIGSVQVNPAPQAIGGIITIEATGVIDFDGDPIYGMTFWRESNGTPGLQTTGPNADEYIGLKTKRSNGKWVITAPTSALSPGQETFYARAVDDLGAAVTRAGLGTLVAPQTIPTKPTGLSVEALSSSRLLLEWLDRSGDESGFVVQRSTSPTFASNIVTYVTAPNTTSLLLTDLPAGTEFYFRVRAFNTAGNSAFSNRAAGLTYSLGEAIVDNKQASLRGEWTALDSANDAFWKSDYLSYAGGARGDRATFTPYIDFAGQYFIYVRWVSVSDNATSVPVDVIINNRITPITVDQTTRGGGWVLLGRFNLGVGDLSSVRINAGRATGGAVIADAVRFLPAF
ncbi:MAG TPA: SdrD B-like domain-containing protein, partial [Tepidisphaeraceae bacterium]|nr:SdrD B-like domain-containing protein [Tepidisphaeraceae bacterium]